MPFTHLLPARLCLLLGREVLIAGTVIAKPGRNQRWTARPLSSDDRVDHLLHFGSQFETRIWAAGSAWWSFENILQEA
jgi:hypothetical protein